MKHSNARAMLARSTALVTPRAVAGARLRADVSNPQAVVDAVNKAFEDFKAENDKKLKAKVDDVVVTEKLDRMNAAIGDLQTILDEMNAQIEAAKLGAGQEPVRDREYTDAFRAYFGKGDEVKAALNKGTDGEGGYLAPVEWDRTITDKLVQVSAMRQIATVQTIGTAGLKKLFNNRGTGSGWVGETAARPETTTPSFSPLDFVPGEIYANPAATQQLLDDAEVNLEEWLAGEVETEFSYQEGLAFVAGNGTNKPFGFLTYVTGAANAAKHPWGAIALTTAASATAFTPDEVINLVYSLPSEYAAEARFVMNRATQGKARTLKDTTGQYLWQPSFAAGQPATLAGFPITEMAAMPSVATGTVPIAFGDFRRGYLIVDRTGVRVLRDPFTNKPYVMFYTTKRVGGGVKDPLALKAMKMA